MPDFGTPFSGRALDRKVTGEELVRAIRFMVAAEYGAIQLYLLELLNMASRVGAIRPHPVSFREVHHLGEQQQCPVGADGRRASAVVEAGHFRAGKVGHFPCAEVLDDHVIEER